MNVVLATGGYDHYIKLWEPHRNQCYKQLSFPDSSINALEITPDKSKIVAAGNPFVRLFDVETSTNAAHAPSSAPHLGGHGGASATPNTGHCKNFDGHKGNVNDVGFQRKAKWMYTAGEDGTVKIWDMRSSLTFQHSYDLNDESLSSMSTTTVESGPVDKKVKMTARLNSCDLHPNQAELITGDSSGRLRILDLTMGKVRAEATVVDAMMPAAAAITGPVPSNPATHGSVGDIPSIQSVSVAVDASVVVAATSTGFVLVWALTNDAAGLRLVKAWEAHPDSYILQCKISPDTKTLATTSSDHTVKLWRLSDLGEDAPMIPIKTLTKHQKWVWDCAFSADSKYLVSASSDQSARLWDLDQGEVIRDYLGHRFPIVAVAMNDSA